MEEVLIIRKLRNLTKNMLPVPKDTWLSVVSGVAIGAHFIGFSRTNRITGHIKFDYRHRNCNSLDTITNLGNCSLELDLDLMAKSMYEYRVVVAGIRNNKKRNLII